MSPAAQGTISRAPRPSSLADVLDLILDKGLVIDAYVRVSAVGIEVLTIDARIVVASVDTYLHFAEAVNRLDLPQTETRGISGLFDGDRDDQQAEGESDHDDDEEASDRRAPQSSHRLGGGTLRQPGELVRRVADRGKWGNE